ncbi:hypothetical protein JCM33374_g4876 [Metschnikowia sp. JCM 33374]|nr:hypothetical protein JCM33374_g4876 [Metschnikowia sp. JCM 33374]
MVFNVSASVERTDVAPDELPYRVTKLENVPIPMSDGKLLYAHIWIPQDALDGKINVGTLVEYLPYRKNDFTAIRDSIRHPYYAGYGLASIRVDMRGCGDSDDVIHGEYLKQEQEDNLVVFDWIVAQKWSNGSLGQFGKSWGGFNGLQVAARQHPNLKTIITLCSTDDRYADDVHYRGGCLLASDMLWWASTMFAYNARPQDPRIRPDWKENWLQRLALEPNIVEWVKHQRRDDFWKHGSVCEDYSKVNIPVLAIGGWRDGYTNAVLRMMKNLPHPDCKGIIGPWVHEYPEVATPYPGMGYNQVAVSWFTKYLTKEASVLEKVNHHLSIPEGFDVHSLNKFTAYLQDPCSVAESYQYRRGKWVSQEAEFGSGFTLFVDGEAKCLKEQRTKSPASISFSGAMEHGLFRGTWCPFGQDGDFPTDQKIEDSKCLVVDSGTFAEDKELLGFPVARLKVSSDSELANLTVRLVDLNPDTKENYLVSWGILNLSHANGTSEHPQRLQTGHVYDFDLQLDAVGYKFAKGHRLRLAFSTTDWPSSWPSAKTPTLSLHPGTEIFLPLADHNKTTVTEWPKPEALTPCDRRILRQEQRTRKVIYDYIQGTWTIDDYSDEGKRTIVSNGAQLGSWNKNLWVIKEKDPLSAYNQCDWELTVGREDDWQVKLKTKSTMRADEKNFYLVNELEAFENEEMVFERKWDHVIPRDFV